MSYAVTYYCPHCGTLVSVQREGYLDDKSVTPYPLEGWEYSEPADGFDADGVRFVCGDSDAEGLTWKSTPDVPDAAVNDPDTDLSATGVSSADGADSSVDEPGSSTPDGADSPATDEGVGCGEPFYLSFVRFEQGQEVDGQTVSERVRLADGQTPSEPTGPDGPQPDTDEGGFY